MTRLADDPTAVPADMRIPFPREEKRDRAPVRFDPTHPEMFGDSFTFGRVSDRVHREVRERIRRRRERSLVIEVEQIGEHRYHATGGDDPDGHYLDLTGGRGCEACDCGDYLQHDSLCKHAMATLREHYGWNGIQIRNLALSIEVAKAERWAGRAA